MQFIFRGLNLIADSQHGWLPLPHVDGRKWLRDDDPSHHFRESKRDRLSDGEETEREMWRIGRYSEAVLTPCGKMTVYRVRVTSARWSVRDSRSKQCTLCVKQKQTDLRSARHKRAETSIAEQITIQLCLDQRCWKERTSSVREQEPESLAGV